ncbi:hypothetical protein ACP8HI_19195 [Paenibacillus sp. FA6]|uniref:hypothetical protein n=1 Tax=Paenibacillus sp. FA6 TaxID=3413029 RepID=UPI003F655B87
MNTESINIAENVWRRGTYESATINRTALHYNPKVSFRACGMGGAAQQLDPPNPVGTGEVTAVIRNLYDLLLFDRITPHSAAVEFRLKANAILA